MKFELSEREVKFIKDLMESYVVRGNRQERKLFDAEVDNILNKLNNPISDIIKTKENV